jgi:hypothetical protein
MAMRKNRLPGKWVIGFFDFLGKVNDEVELLVLK